MTVLNVGQPVRLTSLWTMVCLTVAATCHAGLCAPPSPSEFDSVIEMELARLREVDEPWRWGQLVDRGRLSVARGQFDEGAVVLEASLNSASTPRERHVSLLLLGRTRMLAGQAMPADGDWRRESREQVLRDAGRILNEAQRDGVGLNSRQIAADRVTAWSQSGDMLETLAAEHHLRQIDPAMEGTARMDPVTAAVVCYVVFKGAQIVLEQCEFDGYLDADVRQSILNALDIAVGASLAVGGGGLVVDLGFVAIEELLIKPVLTP